MNLQIVSNTERNPYLNSTKKNTRQNFQTPKNPLIIPSLSLEIRSTAPEDITNLSITKSLFWYNDQFSQTQ